MPECVGVSEHPHMRILFLVDICARRYSLAELVGLTGSTNAAQRSRAVAAIAAIAWKVLGAAVSFFSFVCVCVCSVV